MKTKKKLKRRLPLLKKCCSTCPFVEGSKYEFLKPELVKSALTETARICHSTGSNNGINRRTGKPPMLCRGARDVQLAYFKGIGFLDSATDEAWEAKCKEMGIP